MKDSVLDGLFGKYGLLRIIFLLLVCNTAVAEIIPAARRITWQGNAGIPGGIPNRTTVFQTLSAGATLSAIQTALNNCPSNQVVVLAAGTYTISGKLTIPTGKTLRGAGPGQTILNCTGSGQSAIGFGSSVWLDNGTVHSITSGASVGSSSMVLNNTSGMAVGNLMMVDQLNDASVPVTINGTGGACTWASRASGTRAQGQIVEVTGISGNTVTFSPPLYWTYTLTPQALTGAAGCQWAGLENLTLKGNNTGYTTMFDMTGVKYCWVKNIETDYADGDHGEIGCSYRVEVRDNYFHDGFNHHSGSTDCDVMIYSKSSGVLIENNIFWRMHGCIILNWGASGNVIAYNYCADPYDDGSASGQTIQMYEISAHGAHPMFNLFEGNIAGQFRPDSYWGSSSHGTLLRNWFTASAMIYPPYSTRGPVQTNNGYHALQGLRAICMDFVSAHYNVVGNIIGSTWAAQNGGVYMVVAPQNRSYQGKAYFFSLGYSDVSDSGGDSKDSDLPFRTMLNHGNYDFLSNGQKWDATISDHNIPNSYYLTGKPAWFGNLNWPPFNPATGGSAAITNIPAGYRFVFGSFPPIGPANLPPIVVATANPKSGDPGLNVAFSSAGSSDPEGAALSYTWTFGDGQTATTANANHTYNSPGVFIARLAVSDGVNTVNSTNFTIAIAGNQPPVASASANPTTGAAQLTVNFSSAGSSDPDGTSLTYNWTFGDGTTSTAANPSHTYQTASNYVARLTVSDGTNSTLSSPITVTVLNQGFGLVAAYDFDEPGGTTVSDASGNGNSGSINTATRTTGKYGNALSFNGPTAVVAVTDSPTLDLSGAMTLEAWVYPTALSGDTDIIYKDVWSYCLAGSSGTTVRPNLSGSWAAANLFGPSTLALNTWTHVAGTYDGTTMRLFVNGVEVANAPQSGSLTTTTGALMIGGNLNAVGKNWVGLIDEVRIYNRALSGSEIQSDMGAPIGSQRPAPPQNLKIGGL